MADESQIAIGPASRSDLPSILSVQHDAFGRVALSLGIDPIDLPPLRESVNDLESLVATGTRFLAATTSENVVVGSVRSHVSDGIVHVGRLVVASGWLRRGIATRLMNQLEAGYPQARLFTLFTGAEASDSIALYESLGYSRAHTEDAGPVALVWLEKPGPGPRP